MVRDAIIKKHRNDILKVALTPVGDERPSVESHWRRSVKLPLNNSKV